MQNVHFAHQLLSGTEPADSRLQHLSYAFRTVPVHASTRKPNSVWRTVSGSQVSPFTLPSQVISAAVLCTPGKLAFELRMVLLSPTHSCLGLWAPGCPPLIRPFTWALGSCSHRDLALLPLEPSSQTSICFEAGSHVAPAQMTLSAQALCLYQLCQANKYSLLTHKLKKLYLFFSS